LLRVDKEITMNRLYAGIAAAMFAASPIGALAQSSVQVGTLECIIEGGVGLLIGSSRELNCRFTHGDTKRTETYVGRIDKFGLDVGVTQRATMVWAVLAPTRAYPDYALSGDYGGAAADASVGVGGGAKLLVGGSNRTISLQPLSVQGQTGLNVAVGVTAMVLRAVR
jgi:hypothetical protein